MCYKKNILSIVLAVIMLISIPTYSLAQTVTYSDDVPYTYQLTPDSNEWATYTQKSDILAKLQIPKSKLSTITTNALLLTVLDYPYILDYNVFNNLEDAYNTFYADFNGFRELMSRNDLTEKLIEEYNITTIMTSDSYAKKQLESNSLTLEKEAEFSKEFFKSSTLEFLLVCDELHNGEFSGEQKTKTEEIVRKKRNERSSCGLYSSNSEIYGKYVDKSFSLKSASKAGEYATSSSVTTPNGSSVTTYYDRRPELTTAEKNAMYQTMASRYPSATYLRSATVKYNCHSYAWHSQSATNKHWMNDPSKYMSDGSYYRYTTSPRTGMKAYWYTGDHSGIVSKITYSGGVNTFYTTSKWGSYGLYEHVLSNCPYSGTVRFYARSGS